MTPRNVPLVLCGDFNSLPDENVVTFLKRGVLEHQDIHHQSLSHDLDLSSAYEQVTGKENEVTNYTNSFEGALDYIFSSRQSVFASSVVQVPTKQKLRGRDDTPMPNSVFPSDHVSLIAELQLSYLYGSPTNF